MKLISRKIVSCLGALLLCIGWITLTSCYKGHGLDPGDQLSGRPSGIQGTITFQGEWPDSTKEVRIAVLKSYPAGMSDPDSLFTFVLENLIVFSDTIPRFIEEYDYELELKPDLYGWILVAWFPDNESYILGVKELGAYYGEIVEGAPTPVHVSHGEMVEHIDMVADLANVQNEAPFF